MRMSTTSRWPTGTLTAITLALVLAHVAPLGAQEEKDEEPLDAWGRIKHVQDDYFDLRFKEGRSSKDVFVRLGSEAQYLRDQLLAADGLAEGDMVWILANKIERDVPSRGNVAGGTDRQLINVQAILRGFPSAPKRKPQDAKETKVDWYQARVARAGGALSVELGGLAYKVVMRKDTPILARDKSDRDAIQKAGIVAVEGKPTERRPLTKRKADSEKAAFDATVVVVLDPRVLRTVYPLLLE